MKERDFISNVDVVSDDDNDVLSHSDDDEIQVAGNSETSAFENTSGNLETSFITQTPFQPKPKKLKKTNSLKPPETA